MTIHRNLYSALDLYRHARHSVINEGLDDARRGLAHAMAVQQHESMRSNEAQKTAFALEQRYGERDPELCALYVQACKKIMSPDEFALFEKEHAARKAQKLPENSVSGNGKSLNGSLLPLHSSYDIYTRF